MNIQSCPECDALASYGYNDGPCDKHANTKYSSVKELKDKIMQDVEEDDAFEAQLFTKYPALFPRDGVAIYYHKVNVAGMIVQMVGRIL